MGGIFKTCPYCGNPDVGDCITEEDMSCKNCGKILQRSILVERTIKIQCINTQHEALNEIKNIVYEACVGICEGYEHMNLINGVNSDGYRTRIAQNIAGNMAKLAGEYFIKFWNEKEEMMKEEEEAE